MNFKRLVPFLPLACVLILVGCGAPPPPEPLATVELPLTGESVMGSIGEEEYRYFRYQTVEEALLDKVKISSDGRTIDGKEITWEGPVHIYHLAKRIVIYVGDAPEATTLIEQIFGPQIAGDPVTAKAVESSSASSS
jgi:hypothetical protein